jgi:hypothetical protein
MANKSDRLTVLSDAEQFALYGLPDFDDRQRLNYLSLSGPELALASSRLGAGRRPDCAASASISASVWASNASMRTRFV